MSERGERRAASDERRAASDERRATSGLAKQNRHGILSYSSFCRFVRSAETHCRRMIDFLENTLYHVPYHPLVTLQRFTLADLCNENGKYEESKEIFKEVIAKLTITHGKDNPLQKNAEETLKRVPVQNQTE